MKKKKTKHEIEMLKKKMAASTRGAAVGTAIGGAAGALTLGPVGAAAGAGAGAYAGSHIAKSRVSQRKNPSNSAKAASLIKRCRKLWEHYCERPSKVRLQKIVDHCEKMKESNAKTVKYEKAKCMRAVKKEKKILKMK